MDAATHPTRAEAHVATDAPRRYLGQLCKHFAHKLPVALSETTGSIDFPFGRFEAEALPDTLLLRVGAADEEARAKMEDVIARHLVRFAFREELVVTWKAV